METLQRNSNRGSVSTGFNIEHSVKLEDSNNEWLYRASPTAGNRKTYTFSFWIKRSDLGLVNASGNQFMIGQGQHGRMYFGGDYFQYRFDDGHDCRNVSRKFLDTAAWYHFVVSVDTNQSSSSNRVKLYVNGESLAVDDHDGGSYPDIQDSGAYFSTSYLTIGTAPFGGSYNAGDGDYDMSGYLAEFCGIDGTAYAPTDFGEFDEDSGIWKPKDVSELTFGSEGFYLNFSNASNLGEDFSGNDNDFASSNLAAADQATDTPTNNFCTINTTIDPYVGGPPTITEGATIMTAGSSGQQDSYGTMALFKGKWYFEFSVLNVGGLAIANMFGGVVKVNRLLQSSYNNAANGHHSHDGGWGANPAAVGVHAGSVSGFSSVSGAAVDVVIGVAVDMDNGKIWWASGGTYASSSGSVSNPANGTLPQFTNLLTQYPGEPVVPAYNHYVHQATTKGAFNFGNPFDHAFTDIGTNSDANGYGSFAYTPPAGYYAICSKNLAEYG